MIAVNLKTEHRFDPIGLDCDRPFLSWNCEGGVTQTAYELEACSNGEVLWSSQKVRSSQMSANLDMTLSSRQIIHWRVRLWDENQEAGEWSEKAVFEMGLLDRELFSAQWINPELTSDPSIHKPASYLKKSFFAPKGEQARLYISSHGLYEVYLNDHRVGDSVLAPGSNTYDKKITYQTYDVSSLIKDGSNEVFVILGDGWYRSCSGVDGDRNLYGEDIALFFQMELDGAVICASDESWLASQQGPIRENDMQQGEVYDARLEEIGGWHAVKSEPFAIDHLMANDTVPIIEAERFKGTIIITPNGETVIDYGQNLAGYVEFTLHAHDGDTIILTHGETLDENGNFTTENFQDRERHKEGGTAQKVSYICKEGRNHYKTKFSIWGFRYARVETNIDLSHAEFTSIAVYSQMEQTGWFESSNNDINQLVSNSLWSMKSNFCDVPTDCPTRERAAWTGDMGVFIDTGLYFADCYPVVRKWLAECRLNQYEDGRVANIAPKNNIPTKFTEMLSGSVGWGDAIIIVPYTMYQKNGDLRILEENYQMMKAWIRFLEMRASQKGEQPVTEKENPYAAYTIETGVDYGEWCEPDVNSMMAMARPQYKITTAYYAYSGKLMARIAELLGKKEDADHYREIAENAAKAFYVVATEDGSITSDRQAEYVRAISFGLLSDEESKGAASDLNRMIIENEYHLNTGFLSTPSLCKVLAEHGYTDTAYKLLLQDTMPSWLYAVKKGATTIWENWDGINEKGEVKASLNHYSYGAVCGWLFGGVCGIQVNYGEVTIAPQPNSQISYARAVYKSAVGTITSGWSFLGEKIQYEISIPSNVTAKVILPDGREEYLKTGIHLL
ncbi:MAG: family 78 glycoside hydrolase catalytic domain [Lachnospiraceae bacterium]